MVGVARSGREPGACAGARQRDTSGGGRGAGTCLQPGLRSPDNSGPEMVKTRLARIHFLTIFDIFFGEIIFPASIEVITKTVKSIVLKIFCNSRR